MGETRESDRPQLSARDKLTGILRPSMVHSDSLSDLREHTASSSTSSPRGQPHAADTQGAARVTAPLAEVVQMDQGRRICSSRVRFSLPVPRGQFANPRNPVPTSKPLTVVE